MGRLEGKTALVTGAAQGTGAYIARLFAEEGGQVMLADIQQEQGEALAREIGSQASFTTLDVRDPENWQTAVAACSAQFGAPNILVNNAAILLLAPLDEISREDFLRVVEVNQLGPFLGIQAVLEGMKRYGHGSIINIASTAAKQGFAGSTAYCASKYGLRGFSDALREDLRESGIRVTTVFPPATDTTIFDNVEGEWDRSTMKQPEEIAEAVYKAWAAEESVDEVDFS